MWDQFSVSLFAEVKEGDYCMTEKLQANCAQDEVIVMQAARYGRMQLGRCVKVSCEPGYYEIQVSRLHQQHNIKMNFFH